jgi:MFS family permease
MTEWLPPRAPGAEEAPRFDPEPPPRPEALQQPQAPSPPQAPQWAPPAGRQPDRPVFVQPQGSSSSNGLAVASLVCGIAGLVILVFTLGLGFFLAVFASAAAWVLAVAARTRIASGEATGGEGQAKAGLYMGIGGVALSVIAAIVWIALLASGFDIEDWQRELERELETRRDA